jgi:hypothetical protein
MTPYQINARMMKATGNPNVKMTGMANLSLGTTVYLVLIWTPRPVSILSVCWSGLDWPRWIA